MSNVIRAFAIFTVIILLGAALQPAIASPAKNSPILNSTPEPSYLTGATASALASLAQMRTAANQQRDSGLDVDALIAAAPEFPEEGLLLVTRKNTWDSHPQDHDELVQCVEQDSARERDWSGASVVGEVDQDENIHGNDDNYTSYYDAFFYADAEGTWHFATDSGDASEIEIDGAVVASWYGEHGVSDGWSHNGDIELGIGWHQFIYRHEKLSGAQAARTAFKKPSDAEWRAFSTSELTLKPVNLEEGLLLVTRKNTWNRSPQDHAELVQCVEQDAVKESGWSGTSIVYEPFQDENIHGNDDNYTSYYDAFFYAMQRGPGILPRIPTAPQR
jgi:hypothetical protein